ncbi:MAG: LysR family transcriptional regulator [Proteobacteria bacterium]|nr:LysR family transcriptional regulator [Pseudomonadota bacterium]
MHLLKCSANVLHRPVESAQLEQSLGARLIHRNTHGLSPTAAGERYYAACIDILQRVDAASDALTDEQRQPSGRLRVSLPLAIGVLELGQWLPAFQNRYPGIELELSCSDQFVNLASDGFDVALRIDGPLADASMVARTLAVADVVLVAAPAYLARHGVPQQPADLANHSLLVYAGTDPSPEWLLCANKDGALSRVPLHGRLRSDAMTSLHAAALAGLGVAAFTRPTVQAEVARGQLVHVLPDHALPPRRYYAMLPSARHLAPKVRAFVAHMADHYARI